MRGLVSSVYGSQPKGRGFESRLKFFKYFFKANELLYGVLIIEYSHYMSPFIHFNSTRDVTFHVGVVGCLKFPREVMWL
ncbi:MAG: hypothetical protein PV344_03540, partial [Anaplasma sp.]|nr:hypothetical protein [Anaplasma sp.]